MTVRLLRVRYRDRYRTARDRYRRRSLQIKVLSTYIDCALDINLVFSHVCESGNYPGLSPTFPILGVNKVTHLNVFLELIHIDLVQGTIIELHDCRGNGMLLAIIRKGNILRIYRCPDRIQRLNAILRGTTIVHTVSAAKDDAGAIFMVLLIQPCYELIAGSSGLHSGCRVLIIVHITPCVIHVLLCAATAYSVGFPSCRRHNAGFLQHEVIANAAKLLMIVQFDDQTTVRGNGQGRGGCFMRMVFPNGQIFLIGIVGIFPIALGSIIRGFTRGAGKILCILQRILILTCLVFSSEIMLHRVSSIRGRHKLAVQRYAPRRHDEGRSIIRHRHQRTVPGMPTHKVVTRQCGIRLHGHFCADGLGVGFTVIRQCRRTLGLRSLVGIGHLGRIPVEIQLQHQRTVAKNDAFQHVLFMTLIEDISAILCVLVVGRVHDPIRNDANRCVCGPLVFLGQIHCIPVIALVVVLYGIRGVRLWREMRHVCAICPVGTLVVICLVRHQLCGIVREVSVFLQRPAGKLITGRRRSSGASYRPCYRLYTRFRRLTYGAACFRLVVNRNILGIINDELVISGFGIDPNRVRCAPCYFIICNGCRR